MVSTHCGSNTNITMKGTVAEILNAHSFDMEGGIELEIDSINH